MYDGAFSEHKLALTLLKDYYLQCIILQFCTSVILYNQTDISVCMTKEGCEDPFSQEAFLKQCHLIKNTNLQFTCFG